MPGAGVEAARRSFQPDQIHLLAWPIPRGVEWLWTFVFLLPYAALFIAFVVWPVAFGLSFGLDPALYAQVLSDPRYPRVIANTVLFAGLGVNLNMALALLLSGVFRRPACARKTLLAVFMLPWAMPALPAFIAMHWMFIGHGGFVNGLIEAVSGTEGPIWFNDERLALGINILAYIWKGLPFWTLVFLAARMAIPADLHEAAAVDGANCYRMFVHVTFPLLANLYLICTLLSTLWAIGDFTTTWLVSGGAPARLSDVLAAYAFRAGFIHGYPDLGVAAGMTALPVLIPLTIILLRHLSVADRQL